MEVLYLLNYAIFAMFICLFLIETGIGALVLFAYNNNRSSIRRYLLPIWGVDGTFAVFYFVNLIATYPTLGGVVYAYIVPVMLGSLFFLLRNVFVSYSEYIGDIKYESVCMKIYGVSTIIMSFIVISVFTSGLSGIGISVSQNTITLNMLSLFFNPFNILVFIALTLIALSIVGSHFKSGLLDKLSYALLPAAFLIALLSVYLYLPSIFSAVLNNYYLLLISISIMLITIALKMRGSKIARYSALIWIFVSINFFGIVQYPYLMGGKLQFTNYITNSASTAAIALLTTVCGSFLIIAMAIFVYVSYFRK